MSFSSLKPDILLQTVGHSVKSSNGEYLGKIARVTVDEAGTYINYLILKSDGFLSKGERFFAIPASSSFISLTESKSVILQLSKDALHFAKRVASDKANSNQKASIYELV